MPPKPDNRPLHVVLVEDNPGDVLLMREALKPRFPEVELWVQQDGEQMMQWIDRLDSGETPCPDVPDVILLDLNLPLVTGEEVLQRLSRSPVCRDVPTVVVTSSDSPRDRDATARLGVNRYFRKPTDYDEFMKLGDLVGALVASRKAAS